MPLDSCHCVVVLPHIRIQAANAVSSPLTWGFPAPSAFAGFAHALSRQLQTEGRNLLFDGIGIVCHRFEPQLADARGFRPTTFRLTRNPVDKKGITAGIVEEGRTHLTISLVLAVTGQHAPVSADEATTLAEELMSRAESMRIAGGSVLPETVRRRIQPRGFVWEDDSQLLATTTQLKRLLLPGFVLVERATLLNTHVDEMQKTDPTATTFTALLDLCCLHHSADPTEPDAQKPVWRSARRKPGWLVPIPVGYGAISPVYAPGEIKDVRDRNVPFRFVETLLSLGEWISPLKVKNLNDLLWSPNARPEEGLYVLTNPSNTVN